MQPTDRFRTIKISDARFESDNLRYITIKTPHLKGRGNICVFVPPNAVAEDLPIAILLHGVYGSCNSWSKQAGAHRTALKLIQQKKIRPMVLVMPSDGLWGDGSAYLSHNGFDFDKWIVEDVLDAVKLTIPQTRESTTTFIGGLSMGGFGTLMLGAKYPEKFKGFSAHSAITSLPQMELFVEEPLSEYQQVLAKSEDAFLMLKSNRGKLPPLRFDCGTDDLLIEYNRKLHAQLLAEGIKHDYEEFEGGHEWPYWERHLVDTLLFFEKNS
ncbi:MAG: alpha/beta hydrolase-fold protein [Bacteroidota bacterium]